MAGFFGPFSGLPAFCAAVRAVDMAIAIAWSFGLPAAFSLATFLPMAFLLALLMSGMSPLQCLIEDISKDVFVIRIDDSEAWITHAVNQYAALFAELGSGTA